MALARMIGRSSEHWKATIVLGLLNLREALIARNPMIGHACRYIVRGAWRGRKGIARLLTCAAQSIHVADQSCQLSFAMHAEGICMAGDRGRSIRSMVE